MDDLKKELSDKQFGFIVLTVAVFIIASLVMYDYIRRHQPKRIDVDIKKEQGIQGSDKNCWNEYNQKNNRCRALKMDDPYFSQCPSDALNQYNQCMKQ